jgi:hypothetical protein
VTRGSTCSRCSEPLMRSLPPATVMGDFAMGRALVMIVAHSISPL